MRRAGLMVLMVAGWPGLATAEDAWIRIEAKRGPASEVAVAGWRAKFPDVQTFDLPNGMVGIALGPQEAAAAAGRMAQLKATGQIPADSYLTAPGGTAPLAGALAAVGAAVDGTATGNAVTEGAAAQADAAGDAAPAGQASEAAAQAGTHIQLQATPGRISADEALARWRETFPEAGLWQLPGGMFAVALAPQTPEDAAARLAELKAARRVPSDAYLSTTAQLGAAVVAGGAAEETTGRSAFDPVDGPDVNPPQTAAAASTAGLAEPAPSAEAPPAAEAAPVEEPPAPAVMPPLEEVQRALRWAGFYEGEIDGKSGPGTRAAIDQEIAQTSPGQDPAEAMVALLARRDAWRQEIGLQRLDDADSGLSVMAPMARLQFDRTERGLSIYGPKDGSGAALILTRQPGGQQEMLDLAGLVTALGWVPQPARDVARGRVTLDGADQDHHGHAEMRVAGDMVEGWVLIWPQADADNARRLALEIGESLSVTPQPEAPAP